MLRCPLSTHMSWVRPALRRPSWNMFRIFKPKRTRKGSFVRRVILLIFFLIFFLLSMCRQGLAVFSFLRHCNVGKGLHKGINGLCDNLAPER